MKAKATVLLDLLFPPKEKFFGTLVVSIPDINDEEGRTIVADLVEKLNDKDLKFEAKNVEEVESTS